MPYSDLKSRNSSLNLVRILAVFLVISVHFFLNSEFYTTEITGITLYVLCLMRTAFMTCVPLFLLLTGYLMNRKALSIPYYCGIVRTLSLYFLSSLIIVLVRNHRGEMIGFKGFLSGLLDFSDAPYSWYIEMYIGLFLLIPFLNLS